MKKPLSLALLAASTTLMMGIAVPGCPSQEAQDQLKQQVDQLTQADGTLKRQIQQLQTELAETKRLTEEARALVKGIGDAVVAQGESIKKLDASVTQLAAPKGKRR